MLLLAGLMISAPARADSDDHVSATIAEKKAAVPLKKVIRKIRRTYGGRLLKVKLEKERIGRKYVLIYEAKVLMSDGAVLKLYYDAKNMKLLKRKGRYKKRKPRKWSGFFSRFGNQTRGENNGGAGGNGGSAGGGDDKGDDGHDGGGDSDGHDGGGDSDGEGGGGDSDGEGGGGGHD